MLLGMIIIVSWLKLVTPEWSINTWQVTSSLAWWFDADSLAHILASKVVVISTASSVPELVATSLSGIIMPCKLVSGSADGSTFLCLITGGDFMWGNSSSHEEWWRGSWWASGSIWSKSLGLSIWATSVLGVAAVITSIIAWSKSSSLPIWAASVTGVLAWTSFLVLSASTSLSVWAASELALGAAFWASVKSGSLGN